MENTVKAGRGMSEQPSEPLEPASTGSAASKAAPIGHYGTPPHLLLRAVRNGPRIDSRDAEIASLQSTVTEQSRALKAAGIFEEHGKLRWVFRPGRIEVSASGGSEGSRLEGVLRQAGYVIDDQARKLEVAEATIARLTKERDELGSKLFDAEVNVEAGRLRQVTLQDSIDGCAQKVLQLQVAKDAAEAALRECQIESAYWKKQCPLHALPKAETECAALRRQLNAAKDVA